jgi:hypothetical protein
MPVLSMPNVPTPTMIDMSGTTLIIMLMVTVTTR